MGPPGTAVRGGSAQLRSSVGKLAVAATAAPRPAVLKKDLRDSMAGIVLWAAKKFNHKGQRPATNHKGHEGTRSSLFRCEHCVLLPQRATLIDWEEKPQRNTKRWAC